MVDMAACYPKAQALNNIDTVTIAEALLLMFSNFRFQRQILHDKGGQFTLDMMKQFETMNLVRPLMMAPYCTQCNVLCKKKKI